MPNFTVTGVAGFVAPRHLQAIRDTGNRLIAAVDPHDAVGVLDRYSFDVRFFTEFERFDRHLEKLRRGPEQSRVHYVCGPSMVFTNVVNPRSHVVRSDEYRETLVRQGASIGANSTIVCGHSLGRYAFVGAGAVVAKDVPDYALVVGNPARIVGWMCACGIKLATGVIPPADAVCRSCGHRYRSSGGVLEPLAP